MGFKWVSGWLNSVDRSQFPEIGEAYAGVVDELAQGRAAEGLEFGGVFVTALHLEKGFGRMVGGVEEHLGESVWQSA